MMFFYFGLFIFSLTGAVMSDDFCKVSPICQDTCDRTCTNPCGCDGDDATVAYGGSCISADECQGDALLNLRQLCIDSEGDDHRCPNMIKVVKAAEDFATYDFRIDVRSAEEWVEGHSVVSLNAAGLAGSPVNRYMKLLDNLRNNRLLVYCAGGVRAWGASVNLLKFGFRDITTVYDGGFRHLEAEIIKTSEGSESHPSKAYCYLKGSSAICPQPLTISHIRTAEDIRRLGSHVVLLDARPADRFPETLPNATRVTIPEVKEYVGRLGPRVTVVFFCQKGVLSFLAAKEARVAGFTGPLYWIDNAGYPELIHIPGIELI